MILGLLMALAQAAAPAHYAGGAWLDRVYLPVEMVIRDNRRVLAVPAEGLQNLQPVSTDSGRVRFSVASLRFEFPLDAGSQIKGTVTWAGRRYDVALQRVATAGGRLKSFVGTYQTASGMFVHVFERGENGLSLMDEVSGRFNALYSESDSVFFGGPGRWVQFPKEVEVRFSRRQGIRQVQVIDKGALPTMARKVPDYRTEEVKIESLGATLAGTLYLPPGLRAQAPAVVLVHGSDPNRRFSGIGPAFFAARGMIALTYDKRGNGASTGNFLDASLDTLATDVNAAVRYLKQDARVDTTRVGMWGISQGGWIIPLAIQLGARVSFAMLHAGPALSPVEQAHDELRGILRMQNADAAELSRAMAYHKLYIAAVADAARQAAADSAYAVERARSSRWVWSPASAAQTRNTVFGRSINYDPAPALRSLRMPVLALYGAADHLVPPERHVQPLLDSMREIGNDDVTVVVYPKANHRLEVATPGVLRDFTIAPRSVSGYWAQMDAWLRWQRLIPPASF